MDEVIARERGLLYAAAYCLCIIFGERIGWEEKKCFVYDRWRWQRAAFMKARM
jgi:hypothetical protein